VGEITKNPLCWPDHVARTAPHLRERPQFAEHSIAESMAFVLAELNRLNGFLWYSDDPTRIISTNLRLAKSGLSPLSDQKQPTDPGVAVYFTLRFSVNGKAFDRPCVLTCDKWLRVEWNLWAIGLDIEAQRGRTRWGCGTIQQAFRGYLAIPERCGARPWWEVLGINADASARDLKLARDRWALKMHPDKGGTPEGWLEIQNAFEQGMARFR